jgi:adenylate kinase
MKLVFIGPPGAGKGTQAGIWAAKLGVSHISTGEMFRMIMRMDTPVGREVKAYMDRHEFVPDELTVRTVQARLALPDCTRGYILDGFPRTVPQAEAFEAAGLLLDAAIIFNVNQAALRERIVGRRMDPKTGDIYHQTWRPWPPEIEHRLVHREDDTVKALAKRLDDYREKTQPLVFFYEQRKLARSLQASGTPEEVGLAMHPLMMSLGFPG